MVLAMQRSGSSLADDGVVRAAPIVRILHRGAEKFAASAGTADDYESSAPTEQIHYFLSR